jgi:hypothetical protein
MRGNVTRKATRKKGEDSSSRHSERPYLVGYRRPPVTSRFQPGSSGNPKGRPKNSRKISIKEGPNSRRVSKIEGVVLRQLQSALKGNDRSAMAIIKMAIQMGFLEDPDSNPAEATVLSASDERILEQLLTRRHKARRR